MQSKPTPFIIPTGLIMPDLFTDVTLAPRLNLSTAIAVQNTTTYAMPSVNNAHAARFIATAAKKIYSVVIAWSAVATPGTVTLRIETVSNVTGKPTGTLYDANATITFTPTAGVQTLTFASAPTTNLTVGDAYAIVMLTATGGTTHTLYSRVHSSFDFSQCPAIAFTATDGTLRTNLIEAGGIPVGGFILDDGSYDTMGLSPWYGSGSFALFGSDRCGALKLTLDRSIATRGFQAGGLFTRNGTPAGDLRCRLLDSGNSVVSSMSYTLDKDYLLSISANGLTWFFGTPITLTAGTYRLAFDSTGSANGTNNFDIRYAIPLHANFVNSNFGYSQSTNMSTSFTWTDTAGQVPPIGLVLDTISSGSGGGIRIAGRGGLAAS